MRDSLLNHLLVLAQVGGVEGARMVPHKKINQCDTPHYQNKGQTPHDHLN